MATDYPKHAPEKDPEPAAVTMPEQEPENVLKALAPEKPGKVRPITDAGAQYWVCPWCGRSNGIPEITTCACGAHATAAGVEKA